jgi:hypothetical protein
MKNIVVALLALLVLGCAAKEKKPSPIGMESARGIVEDYNCNQNFCRVKIADIKANQGYYNTHSTEYVDLGMLVAKGDEMCLVQFWCHDQNITCRFYTLWAGFYGQPREPFHSSCIWTRCDKSTVSHFNFHKLPDSYFEED